MDWGTVGADELSATLWRERKQLELLLFRLESQLLHVRTGNWQWLKFTAADIEGVLENLRFDTLARNIESSAVAVEWRLPASSTLPMIISAASSGLWEDLLRQHHEALVELVKRVEVTAAANIEALSVGQQRTGEPLPKGAITGDGVAVAVPPHDPSTEDDVMFLAGSANIERALAATRDCSLPLLEEFLGLG